MFDFLRKRDECSCARTSSNETRLCEHLVEGVGLGWNFLRAESAPDDPCPDAWCGQCQDAMDAGADRTRAVTFTTVCDACYERHRERNWPADAAGKLAALLDRARPELIARQESLTACHDLDQYDAFDWDRESATPRLVLSSRVSGRAVAMDVVHVGSHSARSGTWLWSWGHGEIAEPLKAPVRAVRAYGDTHRVRKLATAYWPAKLPDAWDMVAVANHFITCRGTYRLPQESGHDYFLIRSVASVRG